MYIFHPYPEFYTLYVNDYVSANNDSLVIKIIGRNNSFLFKPIIIITAMITVVVINFI